tara:strand:+ start:136 stop:450 length:315 start_codon:yes stop_codon:yes gene_type:complete
MANTYTYSVTSLKKADEVYPSIVKSAVINVTASDGTNQASIETEVRLGPEPQHPNPFTEYADLTEQEIINWTINDPILLMIPKELDKKLIELSQDTVDSNFPWS